MKALRLKRKEIWYSHAIRRTALENTRQNGESLPFRPDALILAVCL